MNKKDRIGNYSLSYSCYKNNIEIIELFIDFANNHNINLELNKIDSIGNNILIWPYDKNNTNTIKLLINYTIKNNYT